MGSQLALHGDEGEVAEELAAGDPGVLAAGGGGADAFADVADDFVELEGAAAIAIDGAAAEGFEQGAGKKAMAASELHARRFVVRGELEGARAGLVADFVAELRTACGGEHEGAGAMPRRQRFGERFVGGYRIGDHVAGMARVQQENHPSARALDGALERAPTDAAGSTERGVVGEEAHLAVAQADAVTGEEDHGDGARCHAGEGRKSLLEGVRAYLSIDQRLYPRACEGTTGARKTGERFRNRTRVVVGVFQLVLLGEVVVAAHAD